jgi:hypothetical protein
MPSSTGSLLFQATAKPGRVSGRTCLQVVHAMSLKRPKVPAIFFIREPLASFGVAFQLQFLLPGTETYTGLIYMHETQHTRGQQT